MVSAKKQLEEEDHGYDTSTASKRKKAIIAIATTMAMAVIDAIQAGGFMEAFAAAGRQVDHEDSLKAEEYERAYAEFLKNPKDLGVLKRLQRAEEALDATTDYTTCAEYGEKKQCEYLKALDFCDQLGPKMQIFNVCRRRTAWDKFGNQCTCGLAYPAKMWEQPTSRWHFKCKVVWQPLVDEQRKRPEDPKLKEWVDDLYAQYGSIENWPKIGCGCGFVPYGMGPSQVVTVEMPDGSYQSFAAARMPSQLDDQIKKVKQHVYMAAANLEPEEVKELIPMCFPMTFQIPGFPYLAHYPIDEWERGGAPYFSEESWYKLAMRIARNDLTNLHNLYEFAEKKLAARL